MTLKKVAILSGLAISLTLAQGMADPQLSTDQRIQRLENQVTYLNQLSGQVQTLNQKVTELTAQLQETNQQLKEYQSSVKAMKFLEQRVMQMSAATKLTGYVPSKPSALAHDQKVGQNEQAAYQAAYKLVMDKHFDEATKAFKAFLEKYPSSLLKSDAYYWLGQLYLTAGQPDLATQQFRQVISDKASDKRAEAMAALGTIFLANGDLAHAKEMFDSVIKDYPHSTAAETAEESLKNMAA